MPIFTFRVATASADAITRGAESTDRSFWKWISASQTASKPRFSAVFICSIDWSKAVDGFIPAGHWNSVKRPNSMAPHFEATPAN
jgi:hypothetical protein